MVIYTMKCPECGNEMLFDTGAVVPKMTDYPERIVLVADERHTCRACRIVVTRHMTRTFAHEKSEITPPRWLTNPPTDAPLTPETGTGDEIAHTEEETGITEKEE